MRDAWNSYKTSLQDVQKKLEDVQANEETQQQQSKELKVKANSFQAQM